MASALSVEQVRQQSLGDLPRCAAHRFGNKTAIIDSDTRLTFAEFETIIVDDADRPVPAGAAGAVFGVDDALRVEAVAAVVVAKPGAILTENVVTARVRGTLAGFKTPKRVVIAEALPKNPSGKILNRQLRGNSPTKLPRRPRQWASSPQ